MYCFKLTNAFIAQSFDFTPPRPLQLLKRYWDSCFYILPLTVLLSGLNLLLLVRSFCFNEIFRLMFFEDLKCHDSIQDPQEIQKSYWSLVSQGFVALVSIFPQLPCAGRHTQRDGICICQYILQRKSTSGHENATTFDGGEACGLCVVCRFV